ncbi:MAG: uridine diphosphate-N-acetylglucosamine-binding protein YvcK [Gracilibacteraceae bacterium]|jgi:uncharacterized cofD-like protein|nr:uridine diphosphate-N-acetylglucosamine-binding protein YvcK [Gracilibacteraceae bacterium]
MRKKAGGAAVRRAHRHLSKGPRIVVVGGGSGLTPLLRGLKKYTSNLSAIVTVGDDGGSSGRLRRELGVPPPGDIRNCLVALAEKEETMEAMLSYRFLSGDLSGHSLGNLILAGLSEQYGDIRKAVEHLGRVFALRGQVYPATLEDMTLKATFSDGRIVRGETALRETPGRISRLAIEPEDCAPLPEVLAAVRAADLIVLGPGSLFTSILPNLLVTELRRALIEAPAPCLYVCNIMTEKGETDGFTAADHLRVLAAHCGPNLVDVVLAAREEIDADVLRRYLAEGAVPVLPDAAAVEALGARCLEASFDAGGAVVRHDPDKLAAVIIAAAPAGARRQRG